MGLKVLTFNFHEPYLCLMAHTGLQFHIGQYESGPLAREWHSQYRPLPKNMTLIEEHAWRRDLAAGDYDVVIAQNETNAWDIFDICNAPALVLCHNRRTYMESTIPQDQPDGLNNYRQLLDRLQEKFEFAFISQSKKDSYGIPGRVILPGIDVDAFGGYTGEQEAVLRVGNVMRARNQMFDVDFQEQVCAGFNNRVAGLDPDIANAKPSESFEDLLDLYRTHRCLLHVTREAFEDGYNLALLEAMACGTPVVSLANQTSPLTDGVDGFVSSDAEVLRVRVQELMDDPDAARALGALGRETIAQKFPIAAFAAKWRTAIEEAAESRRFTAAIPPTSRLGDPEKAPPQQLDRVLMEYAAHPYTTGRYMERHLRDHVQVVTAGRHVPVESFADEVINGTPPENPCHDIDLPVGANTQELIDRLPHEFAPDVHLWVDSGYLEIPEDFNRINAAKVCYLIDTHMGLKGRLELAKEFDYTFLAQKGQLADFVRAGISNVSWLPLACSADLHDIPSQERTIDVSYVGGLGHDHEDRRMNLLEAVANKFPNTMLKRLWPGDMAQLYAQSKIVVNAAVRRDVNMRVFEAMAAGALLITDEADGLEDLFVDGEHLIIYRKDEDLLPLIEHYLGNPEARERIAAAGRELVLKEHTYDRRMGQLLATLREGFGLQGGLSGEARFGHGGYYRSPRPELVPHVPLYARRVLDCGCAGGAFGANLKQLGVSEVVGVEVVERAYEMAQELLDHAIFGSIEDVDIPYDDGHFDSIIFGDVLEHLVEPAETLQKVSRVLAPDGVIVISIPNVRFFEVVKMLAHGRWTYEDAGIMDRTHLRFFTAHELRKLIADAGLEVLELKPLSLGHPDMLPRNPDGSITLGRMTYHDVSDREYIEFLTYQYLVVAGKPGVDRLMRARALLDSGENGPAYKMAKAAVKPDEQQRRQIMATASAREGKLDRAETLYREMLEAEPDHAYANGELGILLVAQDRGREAAAFLDRAIGVDPDHARVIGAQGLLALADNDQNRALELFLQCLRINSNNKNVIAHALDLAESAEHQAEIENIICQYVEFYPGDLEMGVRYAELLYAAGKIEETQERLETLLIFAPNHADALSLMERVRKSA
jgi:glycosyltransferase involved in cell wall biosynthesis/SAM-dependent methyltransferase/Tfp pilus assembly protein PilF